MKNEKNIYSQKQVTQDHYDRLTRMLTLTRNRDTSRIAPDYVPSYSNRIPRSATKMEATSAEKRPNRTTVRAA